MNLKASTLLDAFGELHRGAVVVEVGCIRFPEEIPSDGYSTVHLARAAKQHGWTLHSVDNNDRAVKVARDAVAKHGGAANVHHADGADWLSRFAGPIDALYLDGSAEPAQTLWQFTVATLATVAIVAIDDVQPIKDVERGKGDMLLDELDRLGYQVRIVETEPGYRMAIAVPHGR